MANYAFLDYQISVTADQVRLQNGIVFCSKTLAKHLAGCTTCTVLAATLGHEVDRNLRALQYTDLCRAIEADRVANVQIESVLDKACAQIAQRAAAHGMHITARYSAGYGDFDLKYQQILLRLAGADKVLGIAVTEDNLLLPQKSVTAVVGWRKTVQEGWDRCRDCQLKYKCEGKADG